MTKKKLLLLWWLMALSPAIVGLVGDALMEFNMLVNDGSGGPALLIFLLVYTIPIGVCGHIYTNWYYKKTQKYVIQKESLNAPSPQTILVLVVTIFLLIVLSWID